MATASSTGWAVLLPIKELHLAKSRLHPPSDVRRADLALAMALDVVVAAMQCAVVDRVIAITNDDRARAAVSALGANWVEDDPDSGLNPALSHAAEFADAQGWHKVVAISSDLAALDGAALARLLAQVASGSNGFVRDAGGAGTALLMASDSGLEPKFGLNSANAHLEAGAIDLTAAATHPGLRRDVDTVEDLLDAQRIGVGAHTAALLARSSTTSKESV